VKHHAPDPIDPHRHPTMPQEEQAVPVAEVMGRLLAFPTARDTRATELRDAHDTEIDRTQPVLRLGEALVQRGMITEQTLQNALEEARRTGAVLGQLLVAHGHVHRLDLYRVLSESWGVETCDLLETPPDPALFQRLGLAPEVMAGLSWLPVSVTGDTLLVASMERPSPHLVADIRRMTGWTQQLKVDVTTEWDLRASLLRLYGADLTRVAASRLRDTSPEDSAARVLVTSQVVWLLAALGGAVALLVRFPSSFLFGLFCVLNVCYAGLVWFKAAAIGTGLLRQVTGRVTRAVATAIPDAELPVYTVLVPAFGEANVIGELIEHLGALDYPRDRLEVLLLLEEIDRPTIDAALQAGMPAFFRIVVVPDGQPRTKPKACNVGLGFARGEFLVIFDAEDRPEPDQLRKAVAMFRAGGPELVCLQGRLNYHNWDENLLTRFFALEYSHWFDLMLEGLAGLRLPLPLGGTSNHFRTQTLRDLGAWDPHNVTEDADLGLRAAAKGYRVKTLDSTTYEEACCRTVPWIKQRTRWIKGYMQTALVHTRHPVRFVRAAGLHAAATLLLLVVGTPLAFLASPLLWGFLALDLIQGHAPAIGVGGSLMVTIAAINLLFGNGLMVACSGIAALQRRNYRLAAFSLLMPLYWTLHSIAAWRALGQLITKPSYWEKTPHGLSKTRPPAAVIALAPARPEALSEAA
jgi:cellulose synthase/poly-beta-1,6-N-acetylglucosamine synthase-like glycosyltransferase